MALIFDLEHHPTKKGYFIDGGFGEPIKKGNNSVDFEFRKFSFVDNYRIYQPSKYNDHITGDEKEVSTDNDLRIEMVPQRKKAFSFIGSSRLIKQFNLLIFDYNQWHSDHQYPHLTVLLNLEELPQPVFGVSLYLEPSHKDKIIDDIVNNRINNGSLSFSFPTEKDVLFYAESLPKDIPDDLLLKRQLDPSDFKNVYSWYPTKILPPEFLDRNKTFLEPYEDAPIDEFYLTFGKTVANPNLRSKDAEKSEEQMVIEEHQWQRMNAVFGENEDN
jgi:hypothetical protein